MIRPIPHFNLIVVLERFTLPVVLATEYSDYYQHQKILIFIITRVTPEAYKHGEMMFKYICT